MADHGILKRVLGLKHLLHSPFGKSNIERTIEYFKERTDGVDDYYPCMKAAILAMVRNG